MQMRAVLLSLLAAELSGYASLVPAQNLLFLHDAPIRVMTKPDLDLLEKSMYRALDETPDGDSLNWSNPDTGTHGTITPTASWREQSRPCRTLQFENEAQGKKGNARFDFCKQDDGSWKIVQ